jgi:hypothetical protein
MGMNQKEAVYTAVTNIMGECDGKYEPTHEQRAVISAVLIEGFNEGKIELGREFDEKGLKSYVSGLLSNWLRKDKRLNGGVQYEAKNPGSRAGTGDSQLTAMKALYNQLTDPSDKEEVMQHITARQAELAKAKIKTIDFSALPSELRVKFTK